MSQFTGSKSGDSVPRDWRPRTVALSAGIPDLAGGLLCHGRNQLERPYAKLCDGQEIESFNRMSVGLEFRDTLAFGPKVLLEQVFRSL